MGSAPPKLGSFAATEAGERQNSQSSWKLGHHSSSVNCHNWTNKTSPINQLLCDTLAERRKTCGLGFGEVTKPHCFRDAERVGEGGRESGLYTAQ